MDTSDHAIPIPTPPSVYNSHHNDSMDPFGRDSWGMSFSSSVGSSTSASSLDPNTFSRRRRSSIDTILANLKFVSAFPQRVMQDLVSPVHPNHGEQHGGLKSFGSTAADLGASSSSLQPPSSLLSSARSSASEFRNIPAHEARAAAIRDIMIQNQRPVKMPTAEAFLSM